MSLHNEAKHAAEQAAQYHMPFIVIETNTTDGNLRMFSVPAHLINEQAANAVIGMALPNGRWLGLAPMPEAPMTREEEYAETARG